MVRSIVGWAGFLVLLPCLVFGEPLALEPFWQKAQELAGMRGLEPPSIEPRHLEGQKMGQFDEERYAIYLDIEKISQLTTGSLEYFKMHELVHAAMFKKGIPTEKHHCLMGIEHISVKIGQWIIDTFYPVSYDNGHHPLIRDLQDIEWRYNRGCIGRL